MAITSKKTPRKEKGGKNRKTKSKGPKVRKIADGLAPSEMSKGQLMFHIKRLLHEIEMEQAERNLFLLERQKLLGYWNLCMDRIKSLNHEANNSLARIDNAKREKGAEESLQNQKLRYLQNEEMKNMGFIRLNHLNYMRHISDEIWGIENILRESAIIKRRGLAQALRSQYEIIRSLYAEHANKLQEMILAMSKNIRSREIVFDRHWDNQQEKSHHKLTEMNSTIISFKFQYLDESSVSHDHIILDLQTFFNDMMTNNFAVIQSLKDEIDRKKCANNRLKHNLYLAKNTYRQVTDPLEKLQKDLVEWGTDIKNVITKNIREWHNLRKSLKSKEKCIANMEIVNEILIQQIQQAQANKFGVAKEYRKGVLKIQQQLSMQSIIDHLKLKVAQKDLALLNAVKSSFKSEGKSELEKLYNLHNSSQQFQIMKMKENKRLGNSQNQFNCKYTDTVEQISQVNDEFRSSNIGLINQKGTIMRNSELSSTRDYYSCKYDGLAQGVRSNIKYGGPPVICEQPTSITTNGSNKYLGYGFYYEDPKQIAARLIPVHGTDQDLLFPPITPNNKFNVNENNHQHLKKDPSLQSINPVPQIPFTQMSSVMFETPLKLKSVLQRKNIRN